MRSKKVIITGGAGFIGSLSTVLTGGRKHG